MARELFVSSSPHETKIAVLDDDEIVEVYFERDTDVGLVGSIYKGRVSRVLPGMQSAFVDVGLERDAFLYVSDFFEDADEYDRIVTEAEARVTRLDDRSAQIGATPATSEPPAAVSAPLETIPTETPAAVVPTPEQVHAPVEPAPAPVPPATIEAVPAPAEPAPTPVESAPATTAPPAYPSQRREGGDFRRRDRGGRRRRRRGGRHFGEPRFRPSVETAQTQPTFEILPGESLAKYRNRTEEPPAAEGTEPPNGIQYSAAAEEPEEHLEPEAEIGYAAKAASLPAAEPVAAPSPIPEPVPVIAPPAESAPTVGSVPFASAAPAVTETPRAFAVAPPIPEPVVPVEAQEKPRPLWDRLKASMFGEETQPAQQQEPPVAFETITPGPEPTEFAPETAPEVSTPVPETGPEVGTLPDGHEPATVTAPAEEGAAPKPDGTPQREYTLREPHQRPHFAPRHRRGRRGRGRDRERNFRPQQRHEPRPRNNPPAQISELLKEGQEIIVQIAKEPLGRKGARITSHVALPGRYLVYMPTVDHIGVSRKIASEEERLRLRNIIVENKNHAPGGFIVRTAGAGRPEAEIVSDMKFLTGLWADIRAKAESIKAPALLHSDLDLVQRILRDILSPDFKTIWVDNELDYERTVDFVNRCQPSLVGHVKLYTRDTPLFEEFGIQQEIEKALKPKVWLKSGGYIVINQTEALVAIDVNTGKYVGKTNRLEDTIVKTNIDAVREIVRQIRLRDLGGIIVVDFIDMDERKNRNRVVQALEEALRKDRAPTKILAFNDFGLVAITRKRVKQSLERTLCEPCDYCQGSGWVKSVPTVCHEILTEAKKMRHQLEGDVVTLRVNPEVAKALKSREGVVLSELESLLEKDVIIKSDPNVHQERFEIY